MKLSFLLAILCLLSTNVFAEFQKAENLEQFVLLGDTGKQNEGQRAVADSMLQVCAVFEKCDAAIMLGDNIYPAGMSSINDPIIDRVFKDYYESLNIPFYVVLGNHDYGKLGRNWEKGAFEIEYGKRNPQFILPDFFYIKEFKHMVVAFIDTSRLMWAKDMKEQGVLVNQARDLAVKTNKWFIVAGHHPYLSNGQHGNAGKYDRLQFPYFVSGKFVKRFFDKYISGKADLYFSGHDHSIQFIDGQQKSLDTYYIVSGAGGSGSKLYKRNISEYQTTEVGFVHLKTSAERFEFKVYNDKSEVSFEKVIEKKSFR